MALMSYYTRGYQAPAPYFKPDDPHLEILLAKNNERTQSRISCLRRLFQLVEQGVKLE